jgi:general secretion pathway protein F
MAPIYDFKAYTPDGKLQKGIIEADTVKTARAKLKKQGLMVSEMHEKTAAKPNSGGSLPFFGGRVSVPEMSLFTRQLASLVKANIPLVEALSALVDQTENEKLKVTISQVRQDVNEGSSLAKAVGSHPKIFDNIFVNMIEAGESSGTLGLVLLKLADLKEAQMRLRSKVKGAMTYPVIMIAVGVILMLVIFTAVIPKLAKVFESMNKPMPPITQGLIYISDFVITWWFLIFGAMFFAFSMFKKYIGSKAGRPKWDLFKLNAPVMGPLLRMVAVTRFASTMSALLGSGVPILTSMQISKNLVDSVPIADAIGQARENITEGQSIAEPLRRSGQFPPMMIHMISIGEKTGELAEMLKNVASTYEDQINSKVESMTSLIEPIMIVAMGGMVGFIVISVLMPLMDMSNINQH